MHFVDRDPRDLPAPLSVDDVAKALPVAMMSFVPQATLMELSAGTTGSSADGSAQVVDTASISFVLWRNPSDPDDPQNLAELSDSVRKSLDSPPVRPLPDWMMRIRELMHYPQMWEAVHTTPRRAGRATAVESTLVAHTNHILTNTFREERVVGGFPGQLTAPVAERHIEPVEVQIDGAGVAGIRIDTDPHVFAVGADLGDRILTAVVSRDYLPYITVAFASRLPNQS